MSRIIRTGTQAYYAKLKDPRWFEFRERWISAERERRQTEEALTCQSCERTEHLHLHHRRYEIDRDPWEYPDSDFFLVCAECHEHVHDVERKTRDWIISQCPSMSWEFQYFMDELRACTNPRVALAKAKYTVRQFNHRAIHNWDEKIY